ncbi:SDR family NAD(P)-dependent oxidoreductase [Mucilaginibacter sp. Mucisp86]|uniref:SDR family NAD(P)-dependent oxidoreductase n=1 Tax=Mucilaginibacter sp. Mucisp86 TaxID=3243060 RepID=UPI0039B6D298
MKKVILVTGASSGMGKEAARKLINEGHTVYTVARRIDQMQDLKALGGYPMRMDVTNEEDIQTVVDTIIEKEGKIDVLWNNAGYGLYGSVEDVSLAEARKQMEVNVFGLAAVSQIVVPHMRKAKSGLISDLIKGKYNNHVPYPKNIRDAKAFVEQYKKYAKFPERSC